MYHLKHEKILRWSKLCNSQEHDPTQLPGPVRVEISAIFELPKETLQATELGRAPVSHIVSVKTTLEQTLHTSSHGQHTHFQAGIIFPATLLSTSADRRLNYVAVVIITFCQPFHQD